MSNRKGPQKKDTTQVILHKNIPRLPSRQAAGLVVIYGAESLLGKLIELPLTGVATIGRSRECTIQIDHFSISRRHSQIVSTVKGFMINDIGSTNGTYVNDISVGQQGMLLKHGDQIQLGLIIVNFITAGDIELLYHDEVYRLVSTDGMLHIPNRRYLMNEIEKEISRCRRHGKPACLVFFDLDHFKQINDTYGHLDGDYVLRELAAVVLDKVRMEDTFGRYGGEEFIILMPENDLQSGALAAEKIRMVVEQHEFSHRGRRIPVTISAGVVQWDERFRNAEQFIQAADANMYKAKQNGRNSTVAE